jgi:hypothetical protein
VTTRRTVLALLMSGAILDGCSCEQLPSTALTDCTQGAVFAGSVKTDILFVIDDSLSMEGEQYRLRDALASFIDTLTASPIADDFQIGVTNTSVARFDGSAAYGGSSPTIGAPFPAGTIVAVRATVDPLSYATWGNFLWDSTQGYYANLTTPPLEPRILSRTDVDAFKRNVLQGTYGSGREQPFSAMESAITTLAATGQKNEPFLRPGARLAVIFLSDEDDCSGPHTSASEAANNDTYCNTERAKAPADSELTSIAHFVQVLSGPIAGETRDVVLGAVVGVTCTGGVCTNTLCSGAYRTPNRFLELLANFDPARTMLASVCDATFDAALDQFANAVMSQTMPLSGSVADPAMLIVTVDKPTGPVTCTVAQVGTAGAAAADAIYTPPAGGADATLTFQNGCALAPGDSIKIDIICAG